MPPKTEAPPVPRTRGTEAHDYLCYHGLVPHTPSIRSSDFGKDEFAYYLGRRLSIAPALSVSAALNQGGWYHRWFERLHDPHDAVSDALDRRLDARLTELRESCAALGVIGESRQRILDVERFDFEMAKVYWEATRRLRIPCADDKLGTAPDFLQRSYWRPLGHELLARFDHRFWPHTPLVFQWDLLLYHEKENRIYIVDPKTTSSTAKTRASICPVEPQTRHYMFGLRYMLDAGIIQEKFGLPSDCDIGAMIHIVIQKPTIKLSSKDRPFHLDTTPFKSGPRKGEPRNEKVYSGEPSPSRFLDRCMDWYMGEGEHVSEKPKRTSDPPINLSFTYDMTLDKDAETEYHRLVDHVHSLATRQPYPGNFTRAAHLLHRGSLDAFAPFYLTPVKDWPSIMRAELFVVSPREELTFHLSGSK